MGDFSVKAVLSAVDRNFSSTMKSALGYTNNLKSTLTSGLGFGVLMGAGQAAFSAISGSVSGLAKETINTSDSMQKLQQAMRFSGSSEAEIQRIAGATGSLKTYADKTVFSLQDVMSTFGALSANGIKDADKMTESVGNAVAVFGGGAREFSAVGLAYSQAMAAGALHAQDWNQILNASPQLAGGLKKELIKLNPILGEDFKGAMEDGAITADLLGQAMNNIGMTDLAKDAAQSVTTFEGAMGNLEATAQSGMMKLYDTFAKSSVIDAINGFNDKVGDGFNWLAGAIPAAIEKISPYWEVFKNSFIEVENAFGDAVSAIGGSLGELNGAFGSQESIKNFSDVIGVAKDALIKFSGFLEEHADVIAKVISEIPKLLIAYKGFKIASAVAPGVMLFTKAIVGLAGKGIGAVAGKLLGIGNAQKTVGEASVTSAKQMMDSAKAFMMLGAGVLMIAGGFWLLSDAAINLANSGPGAIGVMAGLALGMAGLMLVAKSVAPALTTAASGFLALGGSILMISAGFWILSNAAISIANAGPLAIGVMVGMVAAIALLAAGAAALGPALTAGAIGFVTFGAAIVLVGLGAVLAAAALMMVSSVLPVVVKYGIEGAVAIAALGAGMIAFAAGAALAGAGCIVLSAGLTAVSVGLVLIGASVLVVAAGVAVLAAGALLLGTGMIITGAALSLVGSVLPIVASGALMSAVSLTALMEISLSLTASLALLAVPLLLLSVTFLAASVSILAFGVSMTTASAGVLIMAVALKSVNSSMESIAGNAKSAEKSITSMVASIDIVNTGLEALGSKAKSTVNKIINVFSSGAGEAKSAAATLMNGFNGGIQSGGLLAIATSESIKVSVIDSLNSAASGAYSCGYNIGIGLANGMRSTLGEVQAAATQLAAAAEKAVRAKAQIHSPSRVSTKLGRFWGMGLPNGIKEMYGRAKRAAGGMIDIISAPSVPAFAGIGSYSFEGNALSDDYSYNQTVYVNAEVTSVMDGKKVGYGSAKYVQEKNKKDEKIRNRINYGNR